MPKSIDNQITKQIKEAEKYANNKNVAAVDPHMVENNYNKVWDLVLEEG